MAKHFREEPPRSTRVLGHRRRKRTAPTANKPAIHSSQITVAQPRHVAADDACGSMPYGQAASYRSSYSNPALTAGYYIDRVPVRGGIYALGRGLLLLIAWLLRLCAYVFVLFVLFNVFSFSILRTYVVNTTDVVTSHLPWHSLGLLAVDTPFGGVFRGDLSIIALLLFILDWAVCRVRASLR